MPLVFSIFLTPHLLPTCMLHSHRCKVCGRSPPRQQNCYAAQEAVRAGTTQDVKQHRLYQQWTDICFTLSFNPDLQDTYIIFIKLLQVYGHRVRHVHYSKCQVDRLGKEPVSQAWEEITATNLLDFLSNPRTPPLCVSTHNKQL